MNLSARGRAAALLACAGLSLPAFVPAPAPVPGPGAVLDAVQKFVAAIDQGDRDRLGGLLAAACPGTTFAPGPDGTLQANGELLAAAVADVDADGRAVTAGDRKAAIDLLVDRVGGKPRGLQSTIRRVRSDCPSADCSWGVVEFDRQFRQGADTVRQPMRATVLVRYEKERNGMAVFAWQAAPAGAPVVVGKQ